MTKARTAAPRVYRDETRTPAAGEWSFELVLTEDDCEKLMTGRVSRSLMESAFRALSWRRSDQAWDDYHEHPCLECAARGLQAIGLPEPLHICRQPGFDSTLHRCLGCAEATEGTEA